MVGQSGMGKSTLLNLLIPDARARTQEYSERLNAGKQTTTASRWFSFDGDSALVDTAGFEEFGLAHLSFDRNRGNISRIQGRCSAIVDFRTAATLEEPGCAIRAALADGTIAPERYEFYRSLSAASLA